MFPSQNKSRTYSPLLGFHVKAELPNKIWVPVPQNRKLTKTRVPYPLWIAVSHKDRYTGTVHWGGIERVCTNVFGCAATTNPTENKLFFACVYCQTSGLPRHLEIEGERNQNINLNPSCYSFCRRTLRIEFSHPCRVTYLYKQEWFQNSLQTYTFCWQVSFTNCTFKSVNPV